MAGAQATVQGAVGIADEVGISPVVVGLTMVAVGTSLPELATSIVAAMKREADIFVGNIVGSCVFNLLFILGITAIVKPIGVADIVIQYDIPIMIGFTFLLIPLSFNLRIGRWESGALLGLYVAYVVFLFVR